MDFMANIDFGTVVLISLTTVGLLEAVKAGLGATKTPGWIWPVVMVLLSIGVGFSTLVQQLFVGLQGAAFAQLSYPLLVKLPSAVVDKLKGKS